MSSKVRVINIINTDSHTEKPSLTTDHDSKSARNPFEVKAMAKNKLEDSFDLDIDVFKESLSKTCMSIIETLNQIPDNDSGFEVDSLSLDLVIDKSGNINILSAVSGNVSVKSGVSIKFQRKNG